MREPEYAMVIRQCCAQDPIFFFSGFCWTFDPRCKPISKLPFILYPFQEEALMTMIRSVNLNDVLIEKSRDMGATWLCLSSFFWYWMFRENQMFLVGSRDQDYVDKKGNHKSLFWKIDYLIEKLPAWLRPEGFNTSAHRKLNHVENPQTGSVIDGEATTENFARGDRRTAIMLDEFAMVATGYKILGSTRDATESRFFNSTPQGTNNAFADVRKLDIIKIRMHWSLHPIKRQGLYSTDERGRLRVLDKPNFPEQYVPTLDGKMRSPWYDQQCKRAVSPTEIAQELDIDYQGSNRQFFKPDAIVKVIQEMAQLPFLRGDLEYDDISGDPIRYREDSQGELKLWLLISKSGKPMLDPDTAIVVGCDIAAGTGASNSCAVGYDKARKVKLFEFASPFIRPEAFAKQVFAICLWLTGVTNKKPFVIWEAHGPGRQFGGKFMELGYGHVYLRANDENINVKVSDIPGWAPNKEAKLVLLGDYRAAVEGQKIVNYSDVALKETLEYIFDNQGGVVHSRALSKADPSGANANHGDRVIADALVWKILKGSINFEATRKKPDPEDVQVGSLAWRRQQFKKQKRARNSPRELGPGW